MKSVKIYGFRRHLFLKHPSDLDVEAFLLSQSKFSEKLLVKTMNLNILEKERGIRSGISVNEAVIY